MNPLSMQTLIRKLTHPFLKLLASTNSTPSLQIPKTPLTPNPQFTHSHFYSSFPSKTPKRGHFSNYTYNKNNYKRRSSKFTNIVRDYDNEDDFGEIISDDEAVFGVAEGDTEFFKSAEEVVSLLVGFGSDVGEVKKKLEQCEVALTTELVVEVLSRVRNDWEVAFMFFSWAGKAGKDGEDGKCSGYTYVHDLRVYHCMIGILGKMRKFDKAWLLIREMRGMVRPETLVIMMRRYCAVHDVGKAVSAFYAMKRFKFDIGVNEFQCLLSALCRYKNVEEAENLLLCNENTFGFETKSFNIVLDGWCNRVGCLRESRRFWSNMEKRGIKYDVDSYSSMISLYSKDKNLNQVLNMYSKMKEAGISPDRKVYSAVINALGQRRLFKEAFNLLRNMEGSGLVPIAFSYNCLIKTLSRAGRTSETRQKFNEMLSRGLIPSIYTCQSLLGILQSKEHVLEVVESMRKTAGCHPTNNTYVLLIRKFCRWHQHENVLKMWSYMVEDGLNPDQNCYNSIIRGLFFNGKVEEAYIYFKEMKQKGFTPTEEAIEIFRAWLSVDTTKDPCSAEPKHDKVARDRSRKKNTDIVNKGFFKHPQRRISRLSEDIPKEPCSAEQKHGRVDHDRLRKKNFDIVNNDFFKQPEKRRITKERGFSFREFP